MKVVLAKKCYETYKLNVYYTNMVEDMTVPIFKTNYQGSILRKMYRNVFLI